MMTTRTKIFITVAISAFVVFGVGGALALTSGTSAKVVPVYTPPTPRVDTPESPSYIAGKTWADLGAEEYASLPAGTQIVDCTPTHKRMPPGAIFESGPGASMLNPGLHYLIDGRCAFDPSALGKPMSNDSVDGTSTKGMVEWTPVLAVKLSSLPSGTRIVNCWGTIKQLPSGVRLQVGNDFFTQRPDFHFLTDGRCAVSPGANSKPPETVTKAYDLQWFGTGMAGTPRVGSSSCFVGDPLNNHCGIETNITVPGMMPPSGPSSTR